LLNQALFRDALVRQHRQSDRFEEPFGLVLVSLARLPGAASVWAQVIEALTASASPADFVGWFEEGLVLGMIRSRGDMDHLETGSTLQTTVERDLARRFPDAGAVCIVRAEVYAPKMGASARPLVEAIEAPEDTHEQVVRQALKRAIDIVGSATLLALTSPAFLVIGALVKLTSDGPIFFRQERVGEHAKPFMMLKFRTMQANAPADIHQQFVADFIKGGQGGEAKTAAAPVFKIVADPRITSIGHFLRRSSLDELPQFWNVLTGDMSLVGPRPPLPYEVKVYKQWHWRRVLDAKPGITGLWQVTGRSRTTFDEMVRLDLRYAKRQSVWADLKILIATPLAVITGKGAH
jgi:lipopolysaccharide/colanic/teichoic acid biosynthesis glycosyltransferase